MPFASRELQNFASSWGFKITNSSPRYPQSNGMSEKTIGTIKQLLRKADDLYIALLEYRNTPVTGIGLLPAQMLNSRRLKSKLPTTAELLQPRVALGARERLLAAQQKQKYYYDRKAKSLKLFYLPSQPRENRGKSAIAKKCYFSQKIFKVRGKKIHHFKAKKISFPTAYNLFTDN